jgi:hypothetical protein
MSYLKSRPLRAPTRLGAMCGIEATHPNGAVSRALRWAAIPFPSPSVLPHC